MNILFVKFAALGDVSYALPTPQAIKAIYPHAQVSWVVGKANSPLIDGLKGLDQIIEVDEKKLYAKSLISRLKELKNLKKKLNQKYDLVIIAHRSIQYTMAFRVMLLAPIYQLSRKQNHLTDLLFNKTSVPISPKTVHETHAIRKLVEKALKTDLSKNWHWDYSHILNSPTPSQKHIVMHLGGGENIAHEFKLKKWPHFEQLIERLTEQEIILVGSKSEQQQAEALADKFKNVKSVAGKTTIPELVKVIAEARIFIGPDSGPLHIADSLGITCVGLYGPTSTNSWGLIGKRAIALNSKEDCSPCYQDDGNFPSCPYNVKCMKNIGVDLVLKGMEFKP